MQNEEVVLPCRASGTPPPKITWEKDGQPLRDNDLHFRKMRSGWLAIPLVRSVSQYGNLTLKYVSKLMVVEASKIFGLEILMFFNIDKYLTEWKIPAHLLVLQKMMPAESPLLLT